MYLKPLILNLLFITAVQALQAQKVVRKGVTPVKVDKKGPLAQYTVSQLSGKWQEIKRVTSGSKEAIEFPDTLLMKFTDDKVELKDAVSMRMSMEGKVQIEAPNVLIVAGDIYTIRSLDKNNLVIDDGEFIKYMQKKERFNYETVGNLRVDKDSFPNPINIDIKNIQGRWMVYAKHAEPGAVKENVELIKSLNIITIADDGTASGEVTFYTTYTTRSAHCKMIIKDGSINISTDKNTWNFHTYKADGSEFVFGDTGGLLYYSKHL